MASRQANCRRNHGRDKETVDRRSNRVRLLPAQVVTQVAKDFRLLQFPRLQSHSVAADTQPVGAVASDSCRSVHVAFARYRPSRPPEDCVTSSFPRSLYVATLQRCALRIPLFRECCRRASPWRSPITAPQATRAESLNVVRTLTDLTTRLSPDTPGPGVLSVSSLPPVPIYERGPGTALRRILNGAACSSFQHLRWNACPAVMPRVV